MPAVTEPPKKQQKTVKASIFFFYIDTKRRKRNCKQQYNDGTAFSFHMKEQKTAKKQ